MELLIDHAVKIVLITGTSPERNLFVRPHPSPNSHTDSANDLNVQTYHKNILLNNAAHFFDENYLGSKYAVRKCFLNF